MIRIVEIQHIEDLAEYHHDWGGLLDQTAGACFFSRWNGWRSFGGTLGKENNFGFWSCWTMNRPPRHFAAGRASREPSKVGRLRVLTFPLFDWGSFYGPIGPDPASDLDLGDGICPKPPRDWDILELRWQGTLGADPALAPARHARCRFSSLRDCLGTNRNRRSRRHVGFVLGLAKRCLAAAFSPCGTQTRRTRRSGLCALPAEGSDPRRRLAPMGFV